MSSSYTTGVTPTQNSNYIIENFFTTMTDVMLNELLHRIDNNQLEHDINANLRSLRSKLGRIKAYTKFTDISNQISLYINIHYNNAKRLHISFHLTGTDFTAGIIGPIHVKNNTQKKRGFRFRCHNTRKVKLSHSVNKINAYTPITNPDKNKVTCMVLDVLNHYLDLTGPLTLNKKMTASSNKKHKYLLRIINARKVYAPIKQTALTLP